MESGTIVKWLKGEGEPVKRREPLYELDTDKVTQEVEAEAEGVLLKILVAEGEVEVGRTVAVIGSAGEQVPDLSAADAAESSNGAKTAEEPKAAQPQPAAEGGVEPAEGRVVQADGRVKASPLARRIAREK